jgi:GAF domain-containing protein
MIDQTVARDAEERRLQLVLDIARDVTGRRDLADVLAATLGGLRRVIDFGGGSIQLLDDDGWISMAAADPAVPEDVMRRIRVPLGSSVGGRIILTERAVYVPDRSIEAPLPDENFSPGGVRSYFGVPLIADGEAIGLLQIDSPELDPWSEADRLIVICMAPVASAAIQNARAAARQAAVETTSRRLHGRRTLLSALIDNELEASIDRLAGLVEPGSATSLEVERLGAVMTKMRASLDQLVEADGGDAQR